jgi:tRNA A37 threonylcarbamoyltransferase TsaD
MKLQIAIRNEALCSSVFFSLLKKFIGKLEHLCVNGGVCSVANIELGETCEEEGRVLQQAKFDICLDNGHIVHIATSAKTLEDAIYNAFDECEIQMATLQEKRA